MDDIAGKAVFGADYLETRQTVFKIYPVQSTAEGAEPRIATGISKDMYYIIVSQRVTIPRNLGDQVEYSKFGTVRRFKKDKAAHSRYQHPSVRHAMEIPYSFSCDLRIIRKIIPDSNEDIAVGIRQHGKSASVCSDPYAPVIILLNRIDIVRAQGFRIERIPSEPLPLIVRSGRFHPDESVTLCSKPYIAMRIFKDRIYNSDIATLSVRETSA